MKDIFEIKKARLIVKSPIHIGSVEQKLTPFEYIHSSQYIYQISEEKLSLFLQKRKLIDSYVSAISREGHRFKLLEFFRSKGITLKENDLIYLSGGRKTRLQGEASKLQDYRPFIRDGFGNVFIPGTSIKGVIRTAILYNVLLNYRNRDKNGFEQRIIKRINDTEPKRFKKRNAFEWIQEQWLENFEFSGKSKSPHTDWLRMLHVSDAYTNAKIETFIIPVNVLKKEVNDWQYKKEFSGQNTTIWIESIPEISAFEFTISWDKRLLEEFRKQNDETVLPQKLNEVFASVNRWSKDVFDFENGFSSGNDLQNWYRNNHPNFRIGFGSGMTSTTIAILLPEDLRKKIRNFAGRDKRNDIAPKSRRVWIKNNQPIPLGWAVLEILE